MALIAVTSAGGSPGASTTAWGTALGWGSACLFVEADPTGSSALAAGWFRGEVLPTERTVADLSIPARDGRLAEALPNFVGRVPGTEVFVLPGARGHAQAGGISADIWASVGGVLTSGTNALDTIVDVGRLGLAGSPRPLLAAADLTLLVLRNDLPGIIGAQSWAKALRELRSGLSQGLGLVLVTPGVRTRRRGVLTSTPREIARVLGLPVVATVPDAPDEAAVFSHGVPPSRRRSALAEAYVAVGHRARLAIEAGVGALEDDAAGGGSSGRSATMTPAHAAATAGRAAGGAARSAAGSGGTSEARPAHAGTPVDAGALANAGTPVHAGTPAAPGVPVPPGTPAPGVSPGGAP